MNPQDFKKELAQSYYQWRDEQLLGWDTTFEAYLAAVLEQK